ncbi:MAG: 50S ribosomal protein L2 [Anaplasmataceae bacterium]|nr:50S ribosomal protein L2 [Candidatus Heimdallarchaeota archaeon]MDH5796149.1 50S ribosomal protein L2 [Anaplasmataceae bacterium]
MSITNQENNLGFIGSKQILWKGRPKKTLCHGKKNISGRGKSGITVWGRGGGHKRLLRDIDFLRNDEGNYHVQRIEYDPNRTANIALVKKNNDADNDLNDQNNEYKYILATSKMHEGMSIDVGVARDIKEGNCMHLNDIPVGTIINSIEIKYGKGAQICRAAGTYAMILGKHGNKVILKLRSGKQRMFLSKCRAVIGIVSNLEHKNRVLRKAGRSRWMGIRPTVRGVVMNPIDHPHGGGEGKTSGGRHPVTPWGKPTKGKKTVLRSPLKRKKRFKNSF